MKRMLVSVTVPDDWDNRDLVDNLFRVRPPLEEDATAWEWGDFWADVDDGLVSHAGDETAKVTAGLWFGARKIAEDVPPVIAALEAAGERAAAGIEAAGISVWRIAFGRDR